MEKKKVFHNFIFVVIASVIFLAFGAFIWISSKDDVLYSYDNPILTDSPIYEELAEGDSVSVYFNSDTDKYISGITILPVNVSPTGNGSLNIRVDSSDQTVLFTKIDEKDIKVGEWNRIPATIALKTDIPAKVTITAVNCSPFFMYAPGKEADDSGISVGMYTNAINYNQFFAMIAKYAVLVIAFSLVLIIRICDKTTFISKCGNDIFMPFVYIFVCIGIYSAAYKNGIFITADSAGYLREAVNLKAGFGFGYDALAGYRSWFANWPILYPFMIVAVMFVSGLDAYLSSKILTAVLVLVIMIVLRIRFKKKAWVYSIALLNLGFVKLTYYTWSEIPFILFLMLFAFKLGDIVTVDENRTTQISDYVLLGLYGFLAFLTRYFGIFVWVVTGGYIALYLIRRIRTKEKEYFTKALKLAVTAFASGVLSLGYLFLNKLMNGMPSGVSRSTWWDDYRTLTIDLFNSLITELFNVFHINCENVLGYFGFVIKVVFVIVIVGVITFFVVKGLRNKGGIYSSSGAFLILGIGYYAIFTVIRYFSSMDTFYFRFFEPATFLLTVGILMLGLSYFDTNNKIVKTAGILILSLVMLGTISEGTQGLCLTSKNYYDVARMEWDKAYSEIPNRSVVIFSDLDFRSEYYRPDVVKGEISSVETWDEVKTAYYGSDNLIIQREYAESMVECEEYDTTVSEVLSKALADSESDKYICIGLRGN